MKNRFVLSSIIFAALSISAVGQQGNSLTAVDYSRSASLQDLVNQAAHTALTKFADKKLAENQLSITLIDLRVAQRLPGRIRQLAPVQIGDGSDREHPEHVAGGPFGQQFFEA